MVRPWLFLLVVMIAMTGVIVLDRSPAAARVMSASAHYEGGTLIVRGRTARPGQFVSLNRGLIQRSNRVGQFVFRVTRLPPSCTVRLRASGRETRVQIRNCPLRRR
jgi:hypothetical protein